MTVMNEKVITSDSGRLRTDTDRGRLYTWGNEQFRSVTTILGALGKPWLGAWAAKMVAEYAYDRRDKWDDMTKAEAVRLLKGAPWEKRDAAGDVGTAVHNAIESLVLGQTPPPYPDDIAAHMAHFNRFVSDYRPEWHAAEAAVFNRTHKYAGTLDGIVGIGDRTYILDVKTSKAVYPDTYPLQLAAYAHAEFIGLPDGTEAGLPALDGGLILHLTADKYEVIQVRIDEQVFHSFLYVLAAYRWQQDTCKSALMGQLPVPVAATAARVADEFAGTVEG